MIINLVKISLSLSTNVHTHTKQAHTNTIRHPRKSLYTHAATHTHTFEQGKRIHMHTSTLRHTRRREFTSLIKLVMASGE
jgi:hypothetical protein